MGIARQAEALTRGQRAWATDQWAATSGRQDASD
jgi:hypothetical protein